MGLKITQIVEKMGYEDIKEVADEMAREYLEPFIAMEQKENGDKELYLNKHEVILLIKELADKSEPMVSSGTYNYYEINVGNILDAVEDLREYRIFREAEGKNDIQS